MSRPHNEVCTLISPTDQPKVFFGSAYYAEYQSPERIETDFDLMAAAGFSVIRIGESVWSTWEPSDGEFDLNWILPVLNAAQDRGIAVILGTPTYAVPPWLQRAHPEIAAHAATGQAVAWGSRQEIDHSSLTFRKYAERVIRAIVARYADHPAIIGFQVDNEPGLHLLHNPEVFDRFVLELQAQYGSVEDLNREWGLTYWSHRLAGWTELWRPDGNSFPQYDLAWRRFQARLTNEFIEWQAQIVREYAPEKFVTTCMAYLRPSLKDAEIARPLDVTSGNLYFSTQDHLKLDSDLCAPNDWMTSGVAGLFRQADRMYSSKQARFLVTETNAQSVAGSDYNQPPYPGQLTQVALAMVSRGASMIEYWHWQTIHFGLETYWGGILPHSMKPGRVYAEIANIGEIFQKLDGHLRDFKPEADIALVWSDDSRYALEFSPPFRDASGSPDATSYRRLFDSYYRGAIDAGLQVRIIHDDQLVDQSPADLAASVPFLAVPGLYISSDATLRYLEEYAAAGGHLLIGIRTGYADLEARARPIEAPGVLAKPAGIHYEEFSNVDVPIEVESCSEFQLTGRAAGTQWIDGVVVDDATVLMVYKHEFFGSFPALTTRVHGEGRVSYLGTLPNRQLASSVMRWAVPDTRSRAIVHANAGTTVNTGIVHDGTRVCVVQNWSSDSAEVRVIAPSENLLTDEIDPPSTSLSMPPWSSLVLRTVM